MDNAEAICVTVGIYDIYDLYHVFNQSTPITFPHIPIHRPDLYVGINAWYGAPHGYPFFRLGLISSSV